MMMESIWRRARSTGPLKVRGEDDDDDDDDGDDDDVDDEDDTADNDDAALSVALLSGDLLRNMNKS